VVCKGSRINTIREFSRDLVVLRLENLIVITQDNYVIVFDNNPF